MTYGLQMTEEMIVEAIAKLGNLAIIKAELEVLQLEGYLLSLGVCQHKVVCMCTGDMH